MDEVLKIMTEVIPPDWWRVLAFVFAAAFLFLIGKGINVFISFAKKWFDKQEIDLNNLKEIVAGLVKNAEVQQNINNNQRDTNLRFDYELRELRRDPNVKYPE